MLLAGIIASAARPGLSAGTGSLDAQTTISVAATGALRITGSLAATLAGTTIIATAVPPNTAALDVVAEDVTLAGAGQEVPPITGLLDIILSGITIAASGANLPHLAGALSGTLAPVTLAATGGAATSDAVLREDASYELREDGSKILRE
jgi:hypothetical protein